MDVRRPVEDTVYINYLLHTSSDPSKSFLQILEEYTNRPFDDKTNVLAKMDDANKAAFNGLWNQQVAALKALEVGLVLRFPIHKDLLPIILPQLEDKLIQLLEPLKLQMIKKLAEKADKDDKGIIYHNQKDENAKKARKYIDDILRAYAFHLLTDAQKSDQLTDQQMMKIYQEFHRLLRKSIFRGDVCNEFIIALNNALKNKSDFNVTKFGLYQSIFGEYAEEMLQSLFVRLVHTFTGRELLGLRNQILPMVKRDDIRRDFNTLINTYWMQAWTKEITENANIPMSGNLFGLLGDPALGDAVNKTILLTLCRLVKEGKFEPLKSKKDELTCQNSQITFIKTVLSKAAEAEYQQEASQYLQDIFRESTDKKIREVLQPKRGKSNLFQRSATSAATATSAAADAGSSLMMHLK